MDETYWISVEYKQGEFFNGFAPLMECHKKPNV